MFEEITCVKCGSDMKKGRLVYVIEWVGKKVGWSK
jgi:hypothetical protein